MLLLKLVADDGSLIGVINWFAVHGTSMNNTNTLVSGDNKGYAAYLLEKHVNGAGSTPGMGPFVAAFGSTNLGDVSPNTAGAKVFSSEDEHFACYCLVIIYCSCDSALILVSHAMGKHLLAMDDAKIALLLDQEPTEICSSLLRLLEQTNIITL